VPEPENPHDANAIAVRLEEGGTVGYLSRADAVAYGPLLAQCAARGGTGVSEGVILGGDADRDTAFGVWLHLRGPLESLR
jgi:HIRAN domain